MTNNTAINICRAALAAAALLLPLTLASCASKVVVGRSAPPPEKAVEEPAPAAPAPAQAPAPAAEPAPAPVQKKEEPAPAPAAAPDGPAKEEPKAPPKALPSSPRESTRTERPEEGLPAPYELDLSFGGFGLSQGLFDTPVDVAVDEDESIYVIDQGNFRVQKFDRYGIFQFAFGRQGLGDGEFVVENVAGTPTLRMTGEFEFNRPSGMLLDTDETRGLIRISVVDSLNFRVQRFLLTRQEGESFPDEVFVMLPKFGTNAADTELRDRYQAEGRRVILDPLYISDARADNVLLTPFVWGGLGFAQGLFNMPSHPDEDEDGILYVTDAENGRVEGFYVTPQNMATDATFFREFGNDIDKPYGAGRLNHPTAIAFDNSAYGGFFVLDSKDDGGFVIQRFDRQGNFLGVFAESGGKPGQLRQPTDLAVNPFDNTLFVTDRGHRKVMVYKPSGEFMFAFGGEEMSDPRGLTVLRNGYVYVADAAKNMVYRYIPK